MKVVLTVFPDGSTSNPLYFKWNTYLSYGINSLALSSLLEIVSSSFFLSFFFPSPRLHEQIKPPLIAQFLDPYEVTPEEFAPVKYVFFAHVNEALPYSMLK